MTVASIDSGRCDRAPGCPARRVCPQNAVHRSNPGEAWTVNADLCIGCGICVRVCPTGAVSMIKDEG